MSEYSTPAHPPVQAIYQPGAVPQQQVSQAPVPYYYGYYQHPALYRYQVPHHGEGYQPPTPTSKWPLEEHGEGPTSTKFGGAGRGRGRNKEPGHLWGWQRIGYYKDRPSPQSHPSYHSHQKQACASCYTYVPTRKNYCIFK